MVFPEGQFLWCAAYALISWDIGKKQEAKQWAARALEASKLEHSGFRHHPKLGLVGAQYDGMKASLRRIVSE